MSQRQLAERARTAQSVVARIEGGQEHPRLTTLLRLLDAAGYELRAELGIKPTADPQMLDDVPRIRRLSPEDRLREVANLTRFWAGARRV